MPFLGVTSREWVWYKGRGLPATPRTCSTMNICAGADCVYVMARPGSKHCPSLVTRHCSSVPWLGTSSRSLNIATIVDHGCMPMTRVSQTVSVRRCGWNVSASGKSRQNVILMFKTWRKRHSQVPVFGPDCQTRVSMVALQGCVGQDRAACGPWSILGTT